MNEADFLNSQTPEAQSLPEIDPEGPSRFFNRELSWLDFNWRVLEEAENPGVPLLERVRFLSISATNLDEFYTVRVAGLRELVHGGKTAPTQDGLSPAQQLDLINTDARKLMRRQQEIWTGLAAEMAQEDIHILGRGDLTKADRKHVERVFTTQVFPIATPLAIDPAHPFPFLPNTSYTLALELERLDDRGRLYELLPIPQQTNRFVPLPAKPGTHRFILLEDVLLLNLDRLFPGYELKGSCAFRVLRDSDLEVEDEAEDLVQEFEIALKRRRRGEVVRLKISDGAPKALKKLVMDNLEVNEDQVVEVDGLIGSTDLKELVLDARSDLLWPSYTPRVPERVQDYDGDMFAAIRQKDMLLQHPYESFDMVVRFLKQAATDPDVVAIKQTLYRTSAQSPIVDALCEAAEDGKSVTALVELKARFDEAANIRQSRKLERAGVHVVYGFMNYKIHAKISAVVRREGGELATYTHYGTGNYHPITAKVYTDLSFFTRDPALGRDATRVFNYLSGYAQPQSLENLAISPITLKTTLLERIAEEAEHALAGRPAEIWAKMNSLVEKDVIDALYLASQAGVRINLVIRGICCLRPGVAGLSDNIRVKSIVGRFLEHSRIVCFGAGHGLPSERARVYISSADWMGRNLNRRVETLVEIENDTVKAQIVDQIMVANLRDEVNSWVLAPDGTYTRRIETKGAFSCHGYFVENPSLSGRGSAGAKDVKRLAQAGA
ncbi:MAG: RNA degradosome polyphosphate kinase [Pseudomonadota bacterium]